MIPKLMSDVVEGMKVKKEVVFAIDSQERSPHVATILKSALPR